ncbi:hypothetical protein, partial [Acinetobacter bereziniae]|uniref:hypothetical protein n=2 Tax=Moraxellaceae TaxID=468 RepID=UPI00300A409F
LISLNTTRYSYSNFFVHLVKKKLTKNKHIDNNNDSYLLKRKNTMQTKLLLPTVAMLLMSAHASATQTQITSYEPDALNAVVKNTVQQGGYCSNIPFTWEEAAKNGAKCN